jgi:hypothetical protein
MIRTIAATLVATAVMTATPAFAVGDPNDPDWPCVQRKVAELAIGTVWTGPPVEPGSSAWEEDPQVVELVTFLQQRRVPLEEASKAIAAFAEASGADARAKLTLVFAGLFERMNSERRDVVNGIVRFAKKQRNFADQVRASTASLDVLRNDPKADFSVVQSKTDEVLMQTRVFEERQKAITFVCEVPVLIEQRLFALGKAVTAAME